MGLRAAAVAFDAPPLRSPFLGLWGGLREAGRDERDEREHCRYPPERHARVSMGAIRRTIKRPAAGPSTG